MYSKTAIISLIIGIMTIVSIPVMHLYGGFIIPDFPEEMSLFSFLGVILAIVSFFIIKKKDLEGLWVAVFSAILNLGAILIHFYFQSFKIGLNVS